MPPPSRTLSWLQLVLEADPDFRRKSNRPMAYVFSNSRMFYDPVPLYGTPYMTDDFGTIMRDDFGRPMLAGDVATMEQQQPYQNFPFGEGRFGVDPFGTTPTGTGTGTGTGTAPPTTGVFTLDTPGLDSLDAGNTLGP